MVSLLEASHLAVTCPFQSGTHEIIHDVSFEVRHEETLVLLGESGSGKTVLSRALTDLFPANVRMSIEGTVDFNGKSISFADHNQVSQLRRSRIRYIFQEPQQALNPVARIRSQLRLASNGASLDDHALEEVLATVGLVDDSSTTLREDGREVLDLYPHQLSVGMAQRVTIAMAILPSPQLLIADEPTSAVDASLRFKLLDLLHSLQQSRRMSMILITHDLDVARMYGDRIIVLYNGRIIESAARDEFFRQPLHPYSRLLMEAQLQVGKKFEIENRGRLNDEHAVTGCRFHPRCPKAQPNCTESEPPLERVEQEREVRCLYWK